MIAANRWARAAWLAFLLVPACRLAPVAPPGPEVTRMIRLGDEMGYLDYLAQKPRASTADGARLTVLLLGENPWTRSLEEIKTLLHRKEVVKQEWEISEAAPLTRGKLAFMMCYAAGIKTSMIMQLTQPSERMALREAVFHELMVPSATYRYVTGQYLLDVVSRTESWMEKNAPE